MSMPQDLTVSDVSTELRTRREAVIAMLKSGSLAAYDAAPLGAKRKSYRITRQALDDFKAGRSAREIKTSRRKPRAKPPSDFVRYF